MSPWLLRNARRAQIHATSEPVQQLDGSDHYTYGPPIVDPFALLKYHYVPNKVCN